MEISRLRNVDFYNPRLRDRLKRKDDGMGAHRDTGPSLRYHSLNWGDERGGGKQPTDLLVKAGESTRLGVW